MTNWPDITKTEAKHLGLERQWAMWQLEKEEEKKAGQKKQPQRECPLEYDEQVKLAEYLDMNGWNWRPSIHMPKRIARLFLKVTDVRVERLQETTGVDVVREGFKEPQNFIKAWNEIYKEKGYGWDEDPWVWVIEFEVSEIEK
jgi:hypothetical protein